MNKKNVTYLLLLLVIFTIKAQTKEDSLTVTNINWQTTHIEDGIIHKRALFSSLYGGPQYINLIEVDLKKKYRLDFIMTNPLQITSETALQNNAIVAINGSYYDETTGEPTCYFRTGNLVKDTTRNTELYRVTGAIHINKNKVSLIPWDKQTEKVYNNKKGIVLASGPLLINKNKNCDFSKQPNQKFYLNKHPRSAIALTNNNKLILITVDGRQPQHAIGVSIPELTHLLSLLNSEYALNLDGGRSTTLWSSKESGNGVLNSPAANKQFDQYGERVNANTIILTR